MILRKFKFAESPLSWTFDVKGERVATLQQLLEKFYEEWEWDRKFLGWGRDARGTDGELMIRDELVKNYILAPYRRNFYVHIERGYGQMIGPHVARLMYKSWQYPGELLWVGIVQIEALWHSDERVKNALIAEINRKGFYQSPDTAATIVTL